MLPMQGIGQGSQPITSYNYGARNAGRVKETFILLLKVCMIYSVLLCVYTVRECFSSEYRLLLTFTSIGNAPCSIIVAVVRKFILLIPLIYIIPGIGVMENKALDVYLAEPAADVIAVTFTAVLFYFQFRKALKRI